MESSTVFSLVHGDHSWAVNLESSQKPFCTGFMEKSVCKLILAVAKNSFHVEARNSPCFTDVSMLSLIET